MLFRELCSRNGPGAVQVLTLSGESCGYIPTTEKQAYLEHDLIFARVNYIGRSPESYYLGFNIVCQPTLLPAFVSPFPWSILPGTDYDPSPSWEAAMEAALGPQRWKQLSMEAWQRADDKCEVTGMSSELAPLELVPLWRFNEAVKMVQVCPHWILKLPWVA